MGAKTASRPDRHSGADRPVALGRVLRAQWAGLRVAGGSGQDNEDTGIWGVGGPGMRTPGTTGLSRIIPDRRRAPDGEDGENGEN